MANTPQMTPHDHELVTQAVGDAERTTDGEIVTIVTQMSDDYKDVRLHWAIGTLFLFLSSLAIFPSFWVDASALFASGWKTSYSTAQYMSLLLGASLVVFILAYAAFSWMPLRIALAPKSVKEQRVRDHAIEYFKVGAERRTMALTGILIYLSMAEHRAEIVADDAIATKVDPEVWGDAMAALIAEVKQGEPGKGMAAAVEKVGIVLAEHFPKTDANPNELPDRLIEL
ncbi:TPM domain-containing protein [Alterisphingorhabdus coralli]|uniref:TPM domain-containing protein n=1 Tax=Alterisphingorhabdus coralli TaxID=3071408 RepID=A0AA97HZW5_9SPHN|nr:hypothetical protein [Parasphingorhabdus sp. SCSIO 66989]WOE74267.1 hypothetical protein RB602_10420 [Parasphingorhabdus sp. SCSIO 66989]